MTPEELAETVVSAVAAAVGAGELAVAVPETVTVERPKDRGHGDYATAVALRLAKAAGRPPRPVAELLAVRLAAADGIASVDVAGPGFLNIRLAAGAAGELARTILAAGSAYGRSDVLAGQRVNLEFVSADPTGPLHLGHTRRAAVGDALARVLTAAGAAVTREFYVNDAGGQMDNSEDPIQDVRVAGRLRQLRLQQEALEQFRTRFDVWSSEQALHESGAVVEASKRLAEQGHVYEKDGAVWLRTTDFGDDKDRVLIRPGGEQTYFAADCAHYLDKRDRGFSPCIYLLGADHHGHIGRLKAVAACAGDDPDRDVEVLIGQFVKMVRDGAEVKLSKRTGNMITLADVIDLIGVDAARFALARSATDNDLVLDIDMLTRNTSDNPVWTVQYAHSRTCSILRNAADLGLELGAAADFQPELLVHPREDALLAVLADFPRVVAQAAELREVHKIAHYLENLSKAYHGWQSEKRDCRVLPQGDEPPTGLNRARLWLVAATRTVLANGLELLGVSAPERM